MESFLISLSLFLAAASTALLAYHRIIARRFSQAASRLASLTSRCKEESTVRRKLEKQLASEMQWSSELFLKAPGILLVFSVAEDGLPQSFLAANDEACETLGFTRRRLMRMSLMDIEPAEISTPETTFARISSKENSVAEYSELSAAELLEKVRTMDMRRHMRAATDDGDISYTAAYKRRGGATIPVKARARLIERNGINLILLSAVDISSQLKAERSRVESDRRAREYFSKSAIGVAVYNGNQALQNVNLILLRMLGIPDTRMFDRVDFFRGGFVPKRAREALALGQTVRYEATIDFKAVTKNTLFETNKSGKGHFEILMNHLGVDKEFRPKGYYVQVIDLTELKNIEVQLEENERQMAQSQKMEAIGTLAGGIAHDFNNILTPILGYSELVLDSMAKEDLSYGFMKEIVNASLRAKELASQILTFSRQTEPEGRPIHILPIVKEVSKLQQGALPGSITVTLSIVADLDVVTAQPSQIHQVLMNLCTNAGHAMRDHGGELTIEVTNTQIREKPPNAANPPVRAAIRIKVSDTGSGIESDTLDRIFEPFFTTKERGEGTGMGLAVVHGIIKGIKGSINVSSVPGQGTAFIVDIPLETADVDEASVKIEETLPTGTESILFIDDEVDIVNMNKVLLASLGYRPTLNTKSPDAVALFEANPESFDIVITDQMMPNMNGLELTAKIKAIRPDIPVILCSGYTEGVSKDEAREMGISEILHKPIGRRQMAQAIRRALGEAEMVPSLTQVEEILQKFTD
jgi:signal transduction histidine kinase/ActR/RegA family two-component response regulator